MMRELLFAAAALLLLVNFLMHSGSSSRPATFSAAQSADALSHHKLDGIVEELQSQHQRSDHQLQHLADRPADTEADIRSAKPSSVASLSCAQMREQYGVVIGESWGSLSIDGQRHWNELACDATLQEAALVAASHASSPVEGPTTPGSAEPTDPERVIVPEGDALPAQLRQLRRGTDLFVSFASSSMAPFALNWVANLRKAGVKTQLLGTLDEKMLRICEEQGIMALPIEASNIAKRGAANLRFDYGAYKRMAALKVAFYTRILNMGFNVWACDADTGWMGDPSKFTSEYPMQYVDMLTTTDCIDVEGDQHGGCWHVDHNTGLVYMRSRPAVLEFTAAWKKKIESTRDIMVRDQAALNLLMRENFRSKTWTPPADAEGGQAVRPIYLAWNEKIKLARLPLRYFANGHTFFVQRLYAKAQHPPPFVVHMTYQYGDSSAFPYGKRQRMREGRVWQVDPPSYFTAGKYLAIAPEAATLPLTFLFSNVTTSDAADRFNLEEAHMRPVLRDALALAISLNRTLVLPRMVCYCDNIWKEMKHCRVGGAFGMTLPFDCPADHILNLPAWFSPTMPISFREPGFLTDPRLSPEIKHSWVRVKTPPMTQLEARELLKPFEETRVIELAAAKDRFCGFEQESLASTYSALAPQLVGYSRHFCYEDGFKVGPGGIPFYSPCCHGAPGRHFPCKWLRPPPDFHPNAHSPPDFCANRKSMSVVREEVPQNYPDLSPNPMSRLFHSVTDEFRKGFRRES
ncbi:hypothetical protein AB1Y20_002810 [Prymnesium parvum]|uniref:Nucleotide-diphospho-sugar transferase domain-containing protein n=1 Tax=Prymnesium parvum TaxID=97485 RepID=A0AB34JCG7_PRYPA